MAYKKISPGTPLYDSNIVDSRWQNDVSDAARWYKRNVQLGQPASTAPARAIDASDVKLKNLTESAVLRGHALKVGDPLLNPLDPDNPWFEGQLYDGSTFAIARKPTPDDSIIPARTGGVVSILVNVTNLSHTYAAPQSGQLVLASGTEGPLRLLETPSSTGTQELWALFIPPAGSDTVKTFHFKLYNNAKARDDATFEAKFVDGSKNPIGDPVTIHDPFAGSDKGFSSGHHDDSYGRCTMVWNPDAGTWRFEVTHLESVAQFVVATLADDFGYTTPGQSTSTSFAPWGMDLQYLSPGETIELLGNPATHGHLKAGDVVIGALLEPDADPVEYVIIEHPAPQATMAWGVVVDEAPKATAHGGTAGEGTFYINPSTLGTCVLLELVWNDDESEWRPQAMAIPDEGELADILVPFINGDTKVPIKSGKVIRLQSEAPITPGMTVDNETKPPIGTYAFTHDYLQAINGFMTGIVQGLMHDASGDLLWDGGSC